MFDLFVYCKLREQTLVTHSVFGLHHRTIPSMAYAAVWFTLWNHLSVTELFHVDSHWLFPRKRHIPQKKSDDSMPPTSGWGWVSKPNRLLDCLFMLKVKSYCNVQACTDQNCSTVEQKFFLSHWLYYLWSLELM